MFFKKKQEQSAEPAVVSAESSAERKLPLILRWPISIIFLFVMPPFGTAVGIGLAVARLIFNHKYPKYKLKLWTKLIISALCIAFVIWAVVTAPESSTTTSAEAVPTEQGESQATETTSEATENKTVEQYEKLRKEEQMTKQDEHVRKQVLDKLESYEQLAKEEHLEGEVAFERIKEVFGNEVAEREELTERTLSALEHAFEFMEDAFGDSQEMVSFVTELNTNYYSIQFLKENDCDKYYQYNKKLLFDKQQEEILSELNEVEQDLNTAIK